MDKLNDEIRMTPLKWKLQIPSSRLQTKSKIPMIKRHRVALITFRICGLGFIWDLVFWAFKIMTVVLNTKVSPRGPRGETFVFRTTVMNLKAQKTKSQINPKPQIRNVISATRCLLIIGILDFVWSLELGIWSFHFSGVIRISSFSLSIRG